MSNSTQIPFGRQVGGVIENVLNASQPKTHWDLIAIFTFLISATKLLSRPWDKPDPYHHVWFERPQQKDGGSGKLEAPGTRDIAQKLDQLKKDVIIFWGSQSGVAQGFASRLERELLSRFGVNTMSADLSDYDPATICLIPESKLSIFIMSTFGEGDPSDNAVDFMDYLRRAPGGAFSNLRYAAFGLGDSNYQHFNRVINVASSFMNNLGATLILPVGQADAANGATEEHFMEWKNTLLKVLQDTIGLHEKPPTYIPRFEAVEDESLDMIDLYRGEPIQSDSKGLYSPILEMPIAGHRELLNQGATTRSCIHVDFDISDAHEVRYKTGDYLAVWPINPNDEVERILSVLGMVSSRNTPLLLKPLDASAKLPVPTPSTKETLFRHYLDICAPVSRDVILSLVGFAPSPAAQSFLETLAKDKLAYTTFLSQNHLTLGRLLQHASGPEITNGSSRGEGSWSHLPASFIIETLPVLQPRLYSISSSSIISPRHPSLTALVVQTPLVGRPEVSIPGLTSSYLHSQCQLEPAKLHAAIRKSNFRPPAFSHPLVMIAAGTGIAPFRAFVLERARLAQMGRQVGKTLLFFGCRSPTEDFLYEEELENAIASIPEAELVTSFSRATNVGGGRVGRGYVQDSVLAFGSALGQLIVEQGARVYVCGRAAMGREVRAVVREVVKMHDPKLAEDEKRCMEWWDQWRRGGGYVEDVWG